MASWAGFSLSIVKKTLCSSSLRESCQGIQSSSQMIPKVSPLWSSGCGTACGLWACPHPSGLLKGTGEGRACLGTYRTALGPSHSQTHPRGLGSHTGCWPWLWPSGFIFFGHFAWPTGNAINGQRSVGNLTTCLTEYTFLSFTWPAWHLPFIDTKSSSCFMSHMPRCLSCLFLSHAFPL